jgi:hypothetical protein
METVSGTEKRMVIIMVIVVMNAFIYSVNIIFPVPMITDTCEKIGSVSINSCGSIRNPLLCSNPGEKIILSGASATYGCRWRQGKCELNNPCTGDSETCGNPCFWNRLYSLHF